MQGFSSTLTICFSLVYYFVIIIHLNNKFFCFLFIIIINIIILVFDLFYLFYLILFILIFASSVLTQQDGEVCSVYRVTTSGQKAEVVHTRNRLAFHPHSGQPKFILSLVTVLGCESEFLSQGC
jgi:hypothetical protein